MSRPAAFYIVGTDTDVGKTMVTAGLLRALAIKGEEVIESVPRRAVSAGPPCGGEKPHLGPGRRVQALKPVQTGQVIDETIYAQACPEARIRTLRHFQLAASPHLAAAREGRSLDLDQLAAEIGQAAAQADFTLIEGAGGVCTPLSLTETFLDLMTRQPFPVLLVIRNALGAINHSLLSLAALRGASLQVAGLVINQTGPPAAARQMLLDDNLVSIPAISQTPLLAALPHLEWPDRPPYSTAMWTELAEQIKPAAEHLLNLI